MRPLCPTCNSDTEFVEDINYNGSSKTRQYTCTRGHKWCNWYCNLCGWVPGDNWRGSLPIEYIEHTCGMGSRDLTLDVLNESVDRDTDPNRSVRRSPPKTRKEIEDTLTRACKALGPEWINIQSELSYAIGFLLGQNDMLKQRLGIEDEG